MVKDVPAKLRYAIASKAEIKDAIEQKGVRVPVDATLREYDEYIKKIPIVVFDGHTYLEGGYIIGSTNYNTDKEQYFNFVHNNMVVFPFVLPSNKEWELEWTHIKEDSEEDLQETINNIGFSGYTPIAKALEPGCKVLFKQYYDGDAEEWKQKCVLDYDIRRQPYKVVIDGECETWKGRVEYDILVKEKMVLDNVFGDNTPTHTVDGETKDIHVKCVVPVAQTMTIKFFDEEDKKLCEPLRTGETATISNDIFKKLRFAKPNNTTIKVVWKTADFKFDELTDKAKVDFDNSYMQRAYDVTTAEGTTTANLSNLDWTITATYDYDEDSTKYTYTGLNIVKTSTNEEVMSVTGEFTNPYVVNNEDLYAVEMINPTTIRLWSSEDKYMNMVHVHDPIYEFRGQEPTCTEAGYTAQMICSKCGEVLETSVPLDALGHNFVEGVCTRCNELADYTITLNAHGGTFSTGGSTDVTGSETTLEDTTPSTSETTTITVHGNTLNESDIVIPTNSYLDVKGWTLAEDSEELIEFPLTITDAMSPDHTLTIYAQWHCVHNWITEGETVAPTCTEDGAKPKIYCSKCGEIQQEAGVVPALGHDYVDGVCSRCGALEPYTITFNPNGGEIAEDATTLVINGRNNLEESALPTVTMSDLQFVGWSLTQHGDELVTFPLAITESITLYAQWLCEAHELVVEGTYVAPTCTTEGSQPKIYCSKCNEVFYEQSTLPALGHDVVDGVCQRCGETVTDVTEAPVKYLIHPEVLPEGSLNTVDGMGVYEAGDSATLEAVPMKGYQFFGMWNRTEQISTQDGTPPWEIDSWVLAQALGLSNAGVNEGSRLARLRLLLPLMSELGDSLGTDNAESIKKYDLNGDGEVDSIDLGILNQCINNNKMYMLYNHTKDEVISGTAGTDSESSYIEYELLYGGTYYLQMEYHRPLKFTLTQASEGAAWRLELFKLEEDTTTTLNISGWGSPEMMAGITLETYSSYRMFDPTVEPDISTKFEPVSLVTPYTFTVSRENQGPQVVRFNEVQETPGDVELIPIGTGTNTFKAIVNSVTSEDSTVCTTYTFETCAPDVPDPSGQYLQVYITYEGGPLAISRNTTSAVDDGTFTSLEYLPNMSTETSSTTTANWDKFNDTMAKFKMGIKIKTIKFEGPSRVKITKIGSFDGRPA
jgi:hypothetical protein